MNNGINVNSEIGKLKSVLLHRPGAEVENITPDTMKQLLFDDIPYLKIAQKEHDFFAQTLRDNGAETVYIENLATEVFEKSSETKEEFLSHLLHEAGYRPGRTYDGLTEYLTSMSTKDMVEKSMLVFVKMNWISNVQHLAIWQDLMQKIISTSTHYQMPTSHVTHKLQWVSE